MCKVQDRTSKEFGDSLLAAWEGHLRLALPLPDSGLTQVLPVQILSQTISTLTLVGFAPWAAGHFPRRAALGRKHQVLAAAALTIY